MECCGNPTCIFLGVDISPSTETVNFLWERKELISSIRLIKNVNSNNLYNKPRCHVSKGFSISKNTAAVGMLLLKFNVTWFLNLILKCRAVTGTETKLACIKQASFFSVCLWTIFRITFSNSLPVVDKRLIGHAFWGNLGSLPGFDNIVTCTSDYYNL
jgi:hypothetical protein